MLRVQRILDILEPAAASGPRKGVGPVCSELLIEIQSFSTLGLVKMIVRGFRTPHDDDHQSHGDAHQLHVDDHRQDDPKTIVRGFRTAAAR